MFNVEVLICDYLFINIKLFLSVVEVINVWGYFDKREWKFWLKYVKKGNSLKCFFVLIIKVGVLVLVN